MVQILSSALTGGSFSPSRNLKGDKRAPHNIGHFFMAIDPAAFREPGELEHDLEEMTDMLAASPPSCNGKPVKVPGDPERDAREDRKRNGIPIPPDLLEKLSLIARNAGVDDLSAHGAQA